MEKYVRLAVLFLQFLKELEEVLDPEEKSQLEDVILEALLGIAEKLDGQTG